MTVLRPIEDNVLLEIEEKELKTPSWIVLPDTGKEKPNKWKVLAVWKGKIMDSGDRAPIDIKKWDVVYFTKYSPDEVEVDGKTYLIIRHSSILAVEDK